MLCVALLLLPFGVCVFAAAAAEVWVVCPTTAVSATGAAAMGVYVALLYNQLYCDVDVKVKSIEQVCVRCSGLTVPNPHPVS